MTYIQIKDYTVPYGVQHNDVRMFRTQAVICNRSCLACCLTAAWRAAALAAAPRRLSSKCRHPAEYLPRSSYAVSVATAIRIRSTVARCCSCATPTPEPTYSVRLTNAAGQRIVSSMTAVSYTVSINLYCKFKQAVAQAVLEHVIVDNIK